MIIGDKQSKELSWVQKYRPNYIKDVILPLDKKNMLLNMVSTGQLQNLLFYGRQGSGKSTTVFALANTLGWETLIINASDDRGIDVLRTTLKEYCVRGSRDNNPRIVIFEEADNMTTALQSGLRNMIEKYSKRVIFLFTANEPQRIMAPIRESRAVPINFNFTNEEIEEIKKPLFRRIIEICKLENVKISKKQALKEYIYAYIEESCDMRKLIQTMQNISITNAYTDEDGSVVFKIPESIRYNKGDNFNNLIDVIKKKDYTEYYKYVSEHDPNDIFKLVEDNLDKFKDDKIFDVTAMISLHDVNLYMSMRNKTIMVNFLNSLEDLL